MRDIMDETIFRGCMTEKREVLRLHPDKAENYDKAAFLAAHAKLKACQNLTAEERATAAQAAEHEKQRNEQKREKTILKAEDT